MSGAVPDPVAAGAAALARAEVLREPIGPLTESFPGLSLAQAYAIQRRNIDRRVGAGARIVGHKIGLTARAMQELFGVDEPDYGHLLDAMMMPTGATLDLSGLIDPQVEVEPAFVLGRRLCGPGVTASDVLAATDYLCASLEIIDSRIVDWRIRLQDTVADNGSSARVVLGAERVLPGSLELDNLATRLLLDGVPVETGNTGAILGHPANGVAWLANAVAPFGIALEAGHVVLPGTCTRSRRIAGHREARGEIAGLGAVTLLLGDRPAVVRS